MFRRVLISSVLASLLGVPFSAAPGAAANAAAGPFVSARASEPVILTGSQLPSWSRAAATGVAKPYPSGAGHRRRRRSQCPQRRVDGSPGRANRGRPGQGRRLLVDGHRVDGDPGPGGSEIPRLPGQRALQLLCLFGNRPGAHLARIPPHSTGRKPGRRSWGRVSRATRTLVRRCPAGSFSRRRRRSPTTTHRRMKDPAHTGAGQELNDDDEIVFMARDAGAMAPMGQAPPPSASNGQTVTIADPTTGTLGYVYLFITPSGSSYSAYNGYACRFNADTEPSRLTSGSTAIRSPTPAPRRSAAATPVTVPTSPAPFAAPRRATPVASRRQMGHRGPRPTAPLAMA